VNVLRKKHGLEPLKESDELDERCWKGYKPTPGKKPYEKGSCMKENDKIEEGKYSQKTPWALVDTGNNDKIIATGSDESVVKRSITTAHLPPLRVKDKSKLKIVKMKKIQQVGEILKEEAEHEGKKVTLNKPFRTPDGPKKFAVYVKNDKGNVVKVTFGDPNMEIKRDSDDRKANFRARHNCDDPGPKDKARYWSCKMWSNTPVSKLAESEYIDSIQKIKESVIAEGYDFQELSGPKTKKVVGGIAGAPGNSPEDAIKQRMISFGYRNISITLKDGVYSVKAQWGADPKDAYNSYYRLQESLQADASLAAKLFQKFLRSTGAPDKVATFRDVPTSPSKKIFVGQSTNSKFDYTVDVASGVVIATERGTVRNRSFKWNEKTGKLEINESAPPDVDIEKWINNNQQEFSKQYGSEKGKQVLYATAWRMYNNKN
jgi:hypothetical protein